MVVLAASARGACRRRATWRVASARLLSGVSPSVACLSAKCPVVSEGRNRGGTSVFCLHLIFFWNNTTTAGNIFLGLNQVHLRSILYTATKNLCSVLVWL